MTVANPSAKVPKITSQARPQRRDLMDENSTGDFAPDAQPDEGPTYMSL
ncbi:MAG: hypothetical protein WB555_22270 [Candidatus Korobacteraceae bacterium]|jgi:hypothetical protein